MFFGIWQDQSPTQISLIVKDSEDHVVGQVLYGFVNRERTIKVGDHTYKVEFPLTWNRTALLHSPDNCKILARYFQNDLFSRREFDLGEIGKLKEERKIFSLRKTAIYTIGDKVVGVRQNFSLWREDGLVIFLPKEIDLAEIGRAHV